MILWKENSGRFKLLPIMTSFALFTSFALSACQPLSEAGSENTSAEHTSQKPNIIFIMADDMGYADLSVTGARHVNTPHIDSLAANGIRLTDGYANAAICSPTRTGLLSGAYQQRFEVGLHEPLGPWAENSHLPKEQPTIASVLKEQGYETALIGKWHLGKIPENGPLQYGYDHFVGISQGGADYFKHAPIMNSKVATNDLFVDNERQDIAGYLTDIFGDYAVKQIEQIGDKPLFLSLHFTAPHWPWEGREDEEISNSLKSFFHKDGGNIETFSRMMSAMDDNVGKILSALERKGMLDNTIIVFTSDNGGERFSDTWPFIGVKGEVLEGGIRVPILMQWPAKIEAGQISDQMMISMDFLPTFVKIAGGAIPKDGIDGKDLSAQLVEGAPSFSRKLFWRHKTKEQRAMRDGDWKYLKIGSHEHLLNLAEDARERAWLEEKYPDRFQKMKAEWEEWNAGMLPYPEKSFSQKASEYFADRN
ncbi:MAG: sulfatase [Robiginitomaculum sp.]|nr:MAG: sulfatase [Robiginitomaculum sp.]